MPKAVTGWLETPKVRPAEGLMPGLLKLNPELLLLPKPGRSKKESERGESDQEREVIIHGAEKKDFYDRTLAKKKLKKKLASPYKAPKTIFWDVHFKIKANIL